MNIPFKNLFAIILLLLTTFIVTFEMSVVMPLAPFIAQTYQIPSYQVTYLNLGYAFFGMLAPIIGFNADRIGLKKMILLAALLFMTGAMLVGTQTIVLAYIFGRALMGLAYFSFLAILLTYLSLMVKKERLGLISGFHRIAFALAVFASPSLGTWIAITYNLQTMYLLLAATMAVMVVFMLMIPPVSSSVEVPTLVDVKQLLKETNHRRMMLATASLSFPGVFFFNYLSVYLNGLNQSAQAIALVYTLTALGTISAGLVITLFSDSFGKAKMLILSSFLAGFIMIAFYAVSGVWIFVLGFMFGLVFDTIWGLIFPVASLLVVKHSATFLTILSLIMSFVNVLTNFTGPTMYAMGGFLLLIIINSAGMFFATGLLKKATKSIA